MERRSREDSWSRRDHHRQTTPRPNRHGQTSLRRAHNEVRGLCCIRALADGAGAILEIDLTGIVANWRSLAARVEPVRCAAVVKADAYGLGAPQVSAALATAGCRLFFVASLDEGIALRKVLPASCEIAVLNGPVSGSAEEFVAH